jgi:hypothetical protein
MATKKTGEEEQKILMEARDRLKKAMDEDQDGKEGLCRRLPQGIALQRAWDTLKGYESEPR